MNREHAATLTVRAFSIYAGLRGIEWISSMIWKGIGENESEFKMLMSFQAYMPSLLLFACALFLWFSAPYLSRHMFTETDIPDHETVTIGAIWPIVISAIGLLVLVGVIPDIIRTIAITYVSLATYSSQELIIERNIMFATTIVKIVVGVWLLLGAQGVVRALHTLRRD